MNKIIFNNCIGSLLEAKEICDRAQFTSDVSVFVYKQKLIIKGNLEQKHKFLKQKNIQNQIFY